MPLVLHRITFALTVKLLISEQTCTEERPVPYAINAALPISVRRYLPEPAQGIFRAALNHAFAAHADDSRQEEAAHRIAWAAVKRSYVKVGDRWIERASL
jgi:cation transport regulator